jgi:formylglycine-generating enzyme required for sulfatase activity
MKMQTITLSFFSLLFMASVLAQPVGQDGPAQGKTKHIEQSNKPLDSKVAAIIKEIDSRMVKLDGGTFTMGCVNLQDSECYNWEKPRHTVTINTFYLGKFDVTEKEWAVIMGTNPSKKNCDECPVINITWFDATVFINKLNQLSGKNYRLPTEAEWEYAAKGGNKGHGYKYSGDDVASNVAWYDSTISKETHPVGEKKPNELGLYDISGNVWQWCADWFDEKYYSKSPSNNPQGPTTSTTDRVVRGGSWWGPMRDCRVANRDKFPPNSKDDDVGFRLARN